jgi:uncharacterized protein (DUF433 family)
VVAGTGIDVWEIVRVYRSVDEDLDALAEGLPQVGRRRLEAALHYHRCYPREIEERLVLEAGHERDLLAGTFGRSVDEIRCYLEREREGW